MFKLTIVLALALACSAQVVEPVVTTADPDIDAATTDVVTSITEEPEVTTTEAAATTPARTDICAYFVYTRNNPWTPAPVLANADSIASSPIALSRKTVILVHGHRGTGFSSLNPDVRDALLQTEDVNVIVVDWSLYAALTYASAVTTVPAVADSLVYFINELVQANVAALNNIHIVGFNLGAHIAGIAGRSLNKIARITGLDPSGSQWGIDSARLRITDATYVEVIHTDGSGLLSNGIGTPLGQVDFFANGGSNQPGCLSHTCCHNRAYELFAASMVNPNLVGNPCSSMLQMNLNLCRGLALRMGTNDLSKIGYGIYRINTRRSFPY